jgi:hypothetical protein
MLVVPVSASAQETPSAAPETEPDHPPAPKKEAVGGAGTFVVDLLGGSTATNLGFGASVGFFAGPLTIYGANESQNEPGGQSYPQQHQIEIGLAPSLDYFVTDHISVGGRIGAAVTESSTNTGPATGVSVPDAHGYAFTMMPRVGYAIPLSSSFTLWPRLGIGYDVSRATRDAAARDLSHAFYTRVNVGLVVRLAKHVVLDVGPTLTYSNSVTEAPYSGFYHYQERGVEGGATAALRLDF